MSNGSGNRPDSGVGRQLTAGLVLIAVGVALYLFKRLEGLGEEVVLVVLGVAFLAAYFTRREYGFLVPGGILTGLGGAAVAREAFDRGGDVWQLGLGCGFVAIWVIGRLYEGRAHWWPLIPGGILILVGLPRTAWIMRSLAENWPLILVVVGVGVVLSAVLRRPAGPGGDAGYGTGARTGGQLGPPPGQPAAEPPVEPPVEPSGQIGRAHV